MAIELKERLAQAASSQAPIGFNPIASDDSRVAVLRLEDIEPDPDQPRKELGDLEELAASIRVHGLINPIVVEPHSNRRFRIVAGERRFRACKMAGLTQVQAIIRSLEEQSRIEIQLIENLHRKDLGAVEEARVYQRLIEEFGLTQESLAARIGKSQPAINQTLRILALPDSILEESREAASITKSTLLELARERDPERQARLWEKAKRGGLTVRDARKNQSPRTSPGALPKVVFATNHGASVIVQSTSGELTPDQVVAALEEALAGAIGKKGKS